MRSLVVAGDLAGAIGLHPGGWLLLVAAMRGVGRGVEIDDRALTRLVLLGVPSLAIPWILGQVGAGELRPVFVEHAFVASLTFVSAGFMAAGLARLQEIGRETGVDWRTNRSWLGTVLGVLAIVLAVGVPAAYLLGLPVGTVARGLVGPFFSLLGYLLLALAFVAAILSAALYEVLSRHRDRAARTAEPAGARPAAGGTGVHDRPAPGTDHHGRHPVGRRHPPGGDRDPHLGPTAGSWPAARWDRGAVVQHSAGVVPASSCRGSAGSLGEAGAEPRPMRSAPTSPPSTTWRRTIPPRARRDAESPRAHAARVELADLGALQADYALARYGDRHLTDAEHRRGLARWRRIRHRLRGAPVDSTR